MPESSSAPLDFRGVPAPVLYEVLELALAACRWCRVAEVAAELAARSAGGEAEAWATVARVAEAREGHTQASDATRSAGGTE